MSIQVFSYQACDAGGEMSAGKISAETKAEALAKLRSKQLMPVKLEIARGEVDKKSGRKISAEDLADFTTSLGILTEAMSRFPRVFSRLYISLVKAGEAGGILDKLLPELSDYIETSDENRKAVISALTYPAMLMFVGIVSVVLLLFFIVPMFTGVFEGVGMAIPESAQFLMDLSNGLKRYGWLVLPAALLIAYVWHYQGSSPERRVARDASLLRVPILGNFLRYRDSAIFSRTLGALLQAGIPLLQALRIARDGLFNASLSTQLAQVEEDVRGGAALGRSISKCEGFPLLLGQLITIGEESGRSAQILSKLAGIFDSLVKDQMKRFVAILQPSLIIFMGIMVGGIVVVMLSAVFSINTLDI